MICFLRWGRRCGKRGRVDQTLLEFFIQSGYLSIKLRNRGAVLLSFLRVGSTDALKLRTGLCSDLLNALHKFRIVCLDAFNFCVGLSNNLLDFLRKLNIGGMDSVNFRISLRSKPINFLRIGFIDMVDCCSGFRSGFSNNLFNYDMELLNLPRMGRISLSNLRIGLCSNFFDSLHELLDYDMELLNLPRMIRISPIKPRIATRECIPPAFFVAIVIAFVIAFIVAFLVASLLPYYYPGIAPLIMSKHCRMKARFYVCHNVPQSMDLPYYGSTLSSHSATLYPTICRVC